MPTSDEDRKIAEEYYRLALEAKTEADRLALLELSRSWLDTASRESLVPTDPSPQPPNPKTPS